MVRSVRTRGCGARGGEENGKGVLGVEEERNV